MLGIFGYPSHIVAKSYCERHILDSLPDSLSLNREEGFVLIKECSVPGFYKGNFEGLFTLVS